MSLSWLVGISSLAEYTATEVLASGATATCFATAVSKKAKWSRVGDLYYRVSRALSISICAGLRPL
jgi:hypothetical protein